MERTLGSVSNADFYAAKAKHAKMARAMNEYIAVSEKLRWKREHAGLLQRKHPDLLTDEDRAFLEEFKALEAEAEALHCMGTTGSYPPGYAPRPKPDKEPGRPW